MAEINNKIVILNQWFDPEPTFKGLLFAKELKKQGFDVEVVTGYPNYPGGKIYDGHKLGLYKKEIIDGIKVHRVYLYPSHDNSKIKRIMNYGSFAFTSLIFCLFFMKKPKAIYVYHPPLTTGITAAILSKLRGIPFVYDIQDLWPDTLKSTGMVNNKRVLKLVDKLASFVYRAAKSIVVLSEGFKVELVNRGVSSNKINVIYNWADERFIKPEKQENVSHDKPFNLLYAGNFGMAQELSVLIEAAEILKENKNIKITLIGDGAEKTKLVEQIKEKELTNVEVLKSVPVSQISKYLNSADALFVHLKDDPLFRITIPGKTQAYLAAGKPIVMGVKGAASDLIKKSEGGILVESSKPESIADGIQLLANLDYQQLKTMGEKGREYYLQNLSLKSGVDKFARIFNSI
jgi:colanic acid biosynthesis glycosyl transferase WcaI